MAGTSEVLQEYLVKLGFKVDQGELKKFQDSLGLVGKRVMGVGLAVAGVVAGVEAAAAAFAYSMRKVYFDSQLAQSSVKNLQSLEYAGKQVGISAESMGSAIHSMAQAFRLNPGMKGLVESFGIKVEGRDVSDVMTDYVRALNQMPEFQATQFAGMFGMDPDTYHMMREHMGELIAKQQQMKQTYQDLGVDMDKAAKESKDYADSLDNLKMHFGALETTVLSKTLPAFKTFSAVLNVALDDLNTHISKVGVLKAWYETTLGLPGVIRDKAVSNIKGWASGLWNGTNNAVGTTAAQRSTGVLAVPGALAGGAGGGLAGAGMGKDPHAYINALEKQAGLPHDMMWRVYGIESNYGKNPGTSSAGALGPWQFMSSTGADFGLTTDADRMDPVKSAKAAQRYLSRLMTKYGGNVDMALAAYNGGPHHLDTVGLGGMLPETQAYLGKYHAMERGEVQITNTFNITGTNAHDIADKVASAQTRVYGDAMRNTQGAVR